MFFAVDLDNTLIFSYKHYAQGICVETKEGKALSYMTPSAYEHLQQLKERLTIVPLTTRSLEQYQRIQLWSSGPAPYALTSNGAVLLTSGVPDAAWAAQTARLIADSLPELKRALALLQQDEAVTLAPRLVDEAFVYTKSQQAANSLDALSRILDLDKVYLDHNGEKLYVLPKALSKGAALKRLSARLGCRCAAAAGDSFFDLSMLEAADAAIIPQDSPLAEYLFAHKQVLASDRPGERFSEFVLETIERLSLS